MLLLSGHFQGFCRYLYTECVQVVVLKMPPGVQGAIQLQFSAGLKINSSNPTVETLKKDFERFAITLDFGADPANGSRLTHLGRLNKWRNAVAHQEPSAPVGVPALDLAGSQVWRSSCDGLAIWLDSIMYHELQKLFGAAPW